MIPELVTERLCEVVFDLHSGADKLAALLLPRHLCCEPEWVCYDGGSLPASLSPLCPVPLCSPQSGELTRDGVTLSS